MVEGLAFIHTLDTQKFVEEIRSFLQQLVVFFGSPIAPHCGGTSAELQGAWGEDVALLIFDLDVTHHNINRDGLVRYRFTDIPMVRFWFPQHCSNRLEDIGNRAVVWNRGLHDERGYVPIPPRSTSLGLPLEEV